MKKVEEEQNEGFSVFFAEDMRVVDGNDKSFKKRRNYVKNACIPCRKAHAACDETTPCSRCISRNHPIDCIRDEDEELVPTSKKKKPHPPRGSILNPSPKTVLKEHPIPPQSHPWSPPKPTRSREREGLQIFRNESYLSPSDKPVPLKVDALYMDPFEIRSTNPLGGSSIESLCGDNIPKSDFSKNQPNYTKICAPLLPSRIETPPSIGSPVISFPSFPLSPPTQKVAIPQLPQPNSINFESNTSHTTVGSTSSLAKSDTLSELLKGIYSKIDCLETEIVSMESELKETKQETNILTNTCKNMQKQMIYLLHNPVSPIANSDPAISIWEMKTHYFVDANKEFEILLECPRDQLTKRFHILNIFPEFFQPFAFNFYHKLKFKLVKEKNVKIEQVVYIQNQKGEDFPVWMICIPTFEGDLPTRYQLSFKKVVKY